MKINIILALLSAAVVNGFQLASTIGLNKKTTLMASADDVITILGFGSLLSEKSSRTTFPTLKNFRLGRVLDHRRTFAHPASIFFQRNIAKLETLEMSSLSVEYKKGSSMICSVFEVPNEGLAAADAPGDNFVPSQAFLEREEEFEITKVEYEEIASSGSSEQEIKQGVICRRSTDEAYIARWGQERFQKNYLDYGIKTIWGWNEGIRPCVSVSARELMYFLQHVSLYVFSLFISGTVYWLHGVVIRRRGGQKMALVGFATRASLMRHSWLIE